MMMPATAADQARSIDDRRIQGDSIRQIFTPVDHLDHKRLARRHVERIDESLEEHQQDNFRDGDDSGQCEKCQRKRLNHREGLRDDQQFVPVPAINPYACDRREEEERYLADETRDSQQPRGVRQTVNEPTRGQPCHPASDERDALAGEKKPVIPRAESPYRERPRLCGRNVRHAISVRDVSSVATLAVYSGNGLADFTWIRVFMG